MYPITIIHVVLVIYIFLNANSILTLVKKKINLLDIIDRVNFNKFIFIRKQSDKFNYLNKNKTIRQYIWYKIIEKFSDNILTLDIDELDKLKTFTIEQSKDYNILLNESGDIINIPTEIQKLIN